MAIPPMRSRIRRNPVRVRLTPTSRISSREPGTSTPAAIRKAAEDRSPGTDSSSSSSSSQLTTLTTAPSRRTVTPARTSMRSVWSRLGAGSVMLVVPSAVSAASRMQDLTCALATGSS